MPGGVQILDLTTLRRDLGDDDLLAEVAAVFLEDLPVHVGELTQAIAAVDLVRANREAHSIKGAARNFGMDRLAAVAGEVEVIARAGEVARISEALPALTVAADEAATALRAALAPG